MERVNVEAIQTKDANRKYRYLVILTLILSITTFSIAFATISQVIYINGIARQKGSTWSITFDNLSSPLLVGRASVDKPAELKNNSTTINFEISLLQKEDSVTYYFDVKNTGAINAKINAITLLGIPNKTETLTWYLTYADGNDLSIGDILNAGEIKKLKLTVVSTALPTNDISLNLGATIEYIQY